MIHAQCLVERLVLLTDGVYVVCALLIYDHLLQVQLVLLTETLDEPRHARLPLIHGVGIHHLFLVHLVELRKCDLRGQQDLLSLDLYAMHLGKWSVFVYQLSTCVDLAFDGVKV